MSALSNAVCYFHGSVKNNETFEIASEKEKEFCVLWEIILFIQSGMVALLFVTF